MNLSKDTIEFIDQICEDSVNHPVEESEGDDSIAGIAQFIAREVTNDECDPMLDILMAHQQMLERTIRLLKELLDEVVNLKGHNVNLDKRVYAPEEKTKGRGEGKYLYK